MWSGSARPNQALQRTAYHKLVVRLRRWLPPPLSWVVRPRRHHGPPGRSGGSAARPRRPPPRASGTRPPRPAKPVGAGGRDGTRSVGVGVGLVQVIARRRVAGVAPAEPGAAADGVSGGGFTARFAVAAAAELSRSALMARRAAAPFGRFDGAVPSLAVTRLPARGPDGPRSPVGAGGRAGARSASVGLGRARQMHRGVWPGSPRPNQALQRTAYQEAVVRLRGWLPPPLS